MTTCKDLMTKNLVTCEATENVVNVARLMDLANVGSIPVVQSTEIKRLVGIVTDRDIVVRVVANNFNLKATEVAAAMSLEVVTCHPDDDLTIALSKMAAHQIRRIPVVDSNGVIVGIIAQADIARHMDTQATGSVVSEISEPTPVKI